MIAFCEGDVLTDKIERLATAGIANHDNHDLVGSIGTTLLKKLSRSSLRVVKGHLSGSYCDGRASSYANADFLPCSYAESRAHCTLEIVLGIHGFPLSPDALLMLKMVTITGMPTPTQVPQDVLRATRYVHGVIGAILSGFIGGGEV